jgi:hypothetical protein
MGAGKQYSESECIFCDIPPIGKMSQDQARKAYSLYLGKIRAGQFYFEPLAMELVLVHNLAPSELESAMEVGIPLVYEKFLAAIRSGNSGQEPFARNLLEEYGKKYNLDETAILRAREETGALAAENPA